MAIGDSFNDLSMFNEVGIKVLMANVKKEFYAHANLITKSNDEDGVALVLNQLIQTKNNSL